MSVEQLLEPVHQFLQAVTPDSWITEARKPENLSVILRDHLSLLRSEARHYQDYLSLAQAVAGQDISARIAYFAAVEAELITSPDPEFKFHSGVPAWH